MSALAKPHSVFTNAINSTTFVPNEHVISIEKKDIPAINNSKAEYSLVFTSVYPNGATKEVEIKFLTSGARDTSYANWVTANSASVA